MRRIPLGGRGPRIDGERVYRLRVEAGLTQVQLAAQAEIHGCHVSRIETGIRRWPAPRITRSLAAALGVPVDELLADEPVEVGT